jgi:YegS/Rv2252/BmrU family lipid kinase
MKIHLIVNLRSGRVGRNARLLPRLRAAIVAQGIDAEFSVTEGPGHGTELGRRAVAGGASRVVAVGGDGTMNEVAQALVGGTVPLALIPCGSGNGLARNLGIPLSPLRALALAADPSARVISMDTATANGKPFFNAMGLGFDAAVSRRFGEGEQRGLAAYAASVLREFSGRRSERCTVSCGGTRTDLDVLLIAVANSDQYGNGAVIAPGARVDDGSLDLVAVAPVGVCGALGLAARMFLGGFDRSRSVTRLRGPRFLIERPEPGLIHADGECRTEAAVISVAVVPSSLRVVAPALGA